MAGACPYPSGHPFREKKQMLKHSTFRTVALTAATGILATGAVAGGALAATAAPSAASSASVLNTPGDNDYYQGQVIARTGLNIRTRPTTGSADVGTIRYGTVIRIKCKVKGQTIDGNPFWYQLADARFHAGWVTARYVDNIGRAPEYCRNGMADARDDDAIGEAPAKKQSGKQADKQAQKQESDAPLG